MAEGEIPVNIEDLPVSSEPMDESEVYTGELMKVVLAPKLDKNGYLYCSVQVAVTEGDFEGYTVTQNYLPLPVSVSPDAPRREKVQAAKKSEQFGRLARCFKLKGLMPSVRFGDAESFQNWQDWISQFYHNTGKFTAKNEEYPAGSGRLMPKINDYIF